MQGRTSLEDKRVCVIIRGDPMLEHGVIKVNGFGEGANTNQTSEYGIPSDVGLVRKCTECEKRMVEGTKVDIDIDKL